jgi:hypothetical protein
MLAGERAYLPTHRLSAIKKTVNGDQRRKPPFASKSRVLLPSQDLRCLLVAPAVGVNSSLLDGPADPSGTSKSYLL